jgi:cytosine/adenosine deaminase-related metal-dependent hydrolase
MNKLFEMTFHQRTYNGNIADGTTTMYVAVDIYGEVDVFSADGLEHLRQRGGLGNVLGYVLIRHPSIMWGSRDEIMLSFRRAVLRELEERGLVTVNDLGTRLWVGLSNPASALQQ